MAAPKRKKGRRKAPESWEVPPLGQTAVESLCEQTRVDLSIYLERLRQMTSALAELVEGSSTPKALISNRFRLDHSDEDDLAEDRLQAMAADRFHIEAVQLLTTISKESAQTSLKVGGIANQAPLRVSYARLANAMDLSVNTVRTRLPAPVQGVKLDPDDDPFRG